MASENLGPRLGVVAGAALALATILAVLVLSANTSFAGFPRLCRLLAKHQYLPARFIHRGRRLAGKIGGATLAGRVTGLAWRDGLAVGVLVNTRGLVELVLLNIGLDAGLISPTLFTMMVLMAIVTTFMATPLLDRIRR